MPQGASKRSLKSFKPCLFTAPCMYCGKPTIFTHEAENWEGSVRPTLLSVFRDRYHVKYQERVARVIEELIVVRSMDKALAFIFKFKI